MVSSKTSRFSQTTNKINAEKQSLESESHCTKILLTTSVRTRGTIPKLNNTLTNSLSPKRVNLKNEDPWKPEITDSPLNPIMHNST